MSFSSLKKNQRMFGIGTLPVYADCHHFPFATYGLERCALSLGQANRMNTGFNKSRRKFLFFLLLTAGARCILLSCYLITGSAFSLLAGKKKYTFAIEKIIGKKKKRPFQHGLEMM